MARAIVVLCVLVTLAGCNGFAVGGDSRPTLTPAPVPTDRPPMPPGIGRSGTVQPAAVGAAHRRVLANTSYTVDTERRVVDGNRTLRRITHRWRVAADGSYTGVYEYEAIAYPAERSTTYVAYWSNRSVRASKFTTGGYNGTNYEPDTTPSPVIDLDADQAVVGILRAFEPRVVGRTDGQIVVASRELEPGTIGEPRMANGTRNATLLVRITPRGLVTDVRVTFETTLGNRTVRVVREIHVRAVGSTTVERPAWVANASASGERYDSGI